MKYSNQIMDELVGIAVEDATRYPILGLFVQAENVEAIKLYKRFNFASEGLTGFKDSTSEVTYQKMALVLDQNALLQYLDRKKMRSG